MRSKEGRKQEAIITLVGVYQTVVSKREDKIRAMRIQLRELEAELGMQETYLRIDKKELQTIREVLEVS